ncbi:MAG: hypothetical protein LC776_08000 [Acidobacteria bacterium]|nr:hypothetical protein [Acidobacteriota bacterium]
MNCPALRATVRKAYHTEFVRRLPLSSRRRFLYAKSQRRLLHLAEPRTFTEKVNWRIVNDRRDLLRWTCDKMAMKVAAQSTTSSVRIPETLWSGTDLAELMDIDLPDRWVLKPNHRSHEIHFGSGRPTSMEALRTITLGWMDNFQADTLGEWAYSQARRAFLVEEWIADGDVAPTDYKLLVFNGVVQLVDVNSDRFSNRRRRLYRPDWTPLEVIHGSPLAEVQEPPAGLDIMLAAAQDVGAGFDFIRVDFYETTRGVYFGETTPYPSGGLTPFTPTWLDHELGSRWQLPIL